MYHSRLQAALFLVLLAGPSSAIGDDWPQWRGPGDNGSSEGGAYPVRFDENTLRWKAVLPGKGCSTPIVLGQSIFVTAPVEGNDAVLCFNRDGEARWRTAFGPETPGKHRNGSGCNASPVTDGSAVFVYFKSGTLAAVETDGKIRWQTDLVERFGDDERFWDHGTSPVLTDRYVVMARMHAGDSWLAAFDKASGQLAWKVARDYPTPLEGDQCYTTPLVIEHRGRQGLLVWGSRHLTIHDGADGSVVWSCGGFNPQDNPLWPAIANPVVVDDIVVVCYGRNDRRQPRLHGVRLAGEGDATDSSRLWSRDDVGSFVPTPAVWRGRVYLVRDRGEVECLDPATGETVWSESFPQGRAAFYASPLIAGGKLYAAREDGVVFVASVENGRFELLAENDLAESVIASPVPADGRLLIRGERHLFCLSAPEAGQ